MQVVYVEKTFQTKDNACRQRAFDKFAFATPFRYLFICRFEESVFCKDESRRKYNNLL